MAISKNRFFEVQNLALKIKIEFYKGFVFESYDCFARIYFLIAPPPKSLWKVYSHFYFPRVYLALKFQESLQNCNSTFSL